MKRANSKRTRVAIARANLETLISKLQILYSFNFRISSQRVSSVAMQPVYQAYQNTTSLF